MIIDLISSAASGAVQTLFGVEPPAGQLPVQRTIPAFREQGDFSIVVFPLLKISRKSPEETARMLGEEILKVFPQAISFGVVKGYLNLRIDTTYWDNFITENHEQTGFGLVAEATGNPVVVEYSSPNTNKPLHLGHIRNNLLGYSVAQLLKASGKNVKKVNLVNDRGIHICKSMLAWQLSGKNETPESAGKKGDKLVGDYYVKFDQLYKAEIQQFKDDGKTEDEAAAASVLMQQAREMLLKWEARDEDTLSLWSTMNGWVYKGFDVTYKRLGVDFDKIYYESETYLLGKEIVEEGLEKGLLFRKEDGSVWIDLSAEGLDEKLLLRADGTSVYMTQDLGTAQLRADDFSPESLMYVVGNEQNYHFEVLKLILQNQNPQFCPALPSLCGLWQSFHPLNHRHPPPCLHGISFSLRAAQPFHRKGDKCDPPSCDLNSEE